MKLHEALRAVSKQYVPGAIDYFERFTPDPWQGMLDTLEAAVLTRDDELEAHACERFVSRAGELIERFKRDNGGPAKDVSVRDAFVMGDEDRVRAAQSVRHKECARCGARANLRIEATGEGTEVRIVCKGACPTKAPKYSTGAECRAAVTAARGAR